MKKSHLEMKKHKKLFLVSCQSWLKERLPSERSLKFHYKRSSNWSQTNSYFSNIDQQSQSLFSTSTKSLFTTSTKSLFKTSTIKVFLQLQQSKSFYNFKQNETHLLLFPGGSLSHRRIDGCSSVGLSVSGTSAEAVQPICLKKSGLRFQTANRQVQGLRSVPQLEVKRHLISDHVIDHFHLSFFVTELWYNSHVKVSLCSSKRVMY